MTANKYRTERRWRGTVQDVASKVGVHPTTINKRERGEIPISREAAIVLLTLPRLEAITPAHTLGRKPGSKTKVRTE